ncbi:MAG TPA: hypothetical protein VIL65_13690 [Beijerinckiaceae bacterium]|jgi:hypothetical protein
MRRVLIGSMAMIAAATPALAIDGTYRGHGGEGRPGGYTWQVYARVKRIEADRYRANIQVAHNSCASGVTGEGRLVGKTLLIRSESCEIEATFKGQRMRISERRGCMSDHGALCTYDGAARRVGPVGNQSWPRW